MRTAWARGLPAAIACTALRKVAVRRDPIEAPLIGRETALNLCIVLFLSFGALFGLTTYSDQQNELAKDLGIVQSKPVTAFIPVAVTPDKLGDA